MTFSELHKHIAPLVVVFGMTSLPALAGEVHVAVASNFAAPMERIAAEFQQDSGHTVKASLGSTGNLYSQIRNGAPYDIFLSADEAVPARMEQEGTAVRGSRFVYAVGRLVLWSADPGLVDAEGTVLRQGGYNRLAIADPKLAPYGRAAQETLERLALWDAVRSRLIMGGNITQTHQFAATGNAELGFIALSQIMRDGKVAGGSWWLVPGELHSPIRQSAVLLSGAKDRTAAQAFLAFLKGKKASAAMRGSGYELP